MLWRYHRLEPDASDALFLKITCKGWMQPCDF
jgi:hypothetical protein